MMFIENDALLLLFIKVLVEDVEKDCKAYKAYKHTKSKKTFERLQAIQKELQLSITEVNFHTF